MQAALACIRAQERGHVGTEPFYWSTISTQGYMETVNRLMPQHGVDMEELDMEERMQVQRAAKDRRNLEDLYEHGRVDNVKVRLLLEVSGRTYVCRAAEISLMEMSGMQMLVNMFS